MLEKHHLGQALDLHYNINRKLLKLKGWCEVVQPLASVADRSHLSPHTRRERRGVGRRTFVARLTPRVHTVFFFFFFFTLFSSNATSPHTCSCSMKHAGGAAAYGVIFRPGSKVWEERGCWQRNKGLTTTMSPVLFTVWRLSFDTPGTAPAENSQVVIERERPLCTLAVRKKMVLRGVVEMYVFKMKQI